MTSSFDLRSRGKAARDWRSNDELGHGVQRSLPEYDRDSLPVETMQGGRFGHRVVLHSRWRRWED